MIDVEIAFGPRGTTFTARFKGTEFRTGIKTLLDAYEEWQKERAKQFERIKV